jgi:S1-C subfamily serine protease
LALTLELAEGWRAKSDISWRVSTWGLRRMVTGGMVLEPAGEEKRVQSGVADGQAALLVKRAGKYGPHAAARRAGFQEGDVIVSYDGRTNFSDEKALIHYAATQLSPGKSVPVVVRRGNREVSLQLPIQP